MKPLDLGCIQIEDLDETIEILKDARLLIQTGCQRFMCIAIAYATTKRSEKLSLAHQLRDIILANRPLKPEREGYTFWSIDASGQRKRLNFLNRFIYTLRLEKLKRAGTPLND